MQKQGFFIRDDRQFYDLKEDSFSSADFSEDLYEETVSIQYLTSTYGDEVFLPVEIFAGDIAPLQAIIKYAKENLSLSNVVISKILGRTQPTIWITYSKIRKIAWPKIWKSKIRVPLGIFKDDNLSALEVLVSFLRSKGMSNSAIAKLLKKDPRTIWTVYNRAQRKKNVNNDEN